MDKIPPPNTTVPRKSTSRLKTRLLALVTLSLGLVTFFGVHTGNSFGGSHIHTVPINAKEILDKCRQLQLPAGPPSNFHERTVSDRFQAGTPPLLVKNATIWTGRVSGYEVVRGDILIDNGIIQAIGDIDDIRLRGVSGLTTVDAAGAWVTPGIVDMHSHLGVDSVPELEGASDTNSLKGLILPWMRSLDGLNTHDDAYALSIAGGLTTANILPGSANAIGGQAFTIKLRPTSERSPSSMLLEPPYSLNGTQVDPSLPPRWRQMKHACGENPSNVYSGTRMDTIWAFRQGYDTARKIKEQQDDFCTKASAGEWDNLGNFPEDLQWEALVEVLRGRVKVHNHCYEAVDLDDMVRITNEFKFSIAAFHHAHETYLVPDLLKKAYGHPPGIALFATNARYKREAFRGSEFAPRILADNGLQVVMKSDHPVLNSRHLINEAQQAHYYGLSSNLALASVTTTPATILGLDHRVGFIKTGYDADVVIWDSHPLALGAAPQQVIIDGIVQLQDPYVTPKPAQAQRAPATPNFDKEAQLAVEYDGLPPLAPHPVQAEFVLFTNVSRVHMRGDECSVHQAYSMSQAGELGVVLVKNGKVVCIGLQSICGEKARNLKGHVNTINLEGGTIAPALISVGSPLGLEEIQAESSTKDGEVFDPLSSDNPSIIGGDGSLIRAVDGLQFSSRDALLAYRAGVTVGVSAPASSGFLSGLGTAFTTGALHKLSKGAVLQDEVALLVSIGSSTKPSISTQVGVLRRLLNGEGEGDLGKAFKKITKGEVPLVIAVESADIMATLIMLKREIESNTGSRLQFTFITAAEAHLLAKEIGEAQIGVILRPVRPFPATWKSRRILAGPPLTEENAAVVLKRHNVTVGIGIEESWSARNIRFDAGWVALEAGETQIPYEEALAMASTNLEKLLGVKNGNTDLVAIAHGDFLSFEGKPIAIISESRNTVDIL